MKLNGKVSGFGVMQYVFHKFLHLKYLKDTDYADKQYSYLCSNLTLSHVCRVDFSTLTLWIGPFPIKGVSGLFLCVSCFVENSDLNANGVDPDQTPRSGSSLFVNVLFIGR